jgi:hypothetical protein
LDTGFSGDLRRIRGGRKPRSRLYDRVGLPIVLIAVFLSSLFSPLVFLGDFFAALVGMLPKIEAGKLELNSEPVNLARLIDEVIGTPRNSSPRRTRTASSKRRRIWVCSPPHVNGSAGMPVRHEHRGHEDRSLALTQVSNSPR